MARTVNVEVGDSFMVAVIGSGKGGQIVSQRFPSFPSVPAGGGRGINICGLQVVLTPPAGLLCDPEEVAQVCN